MRFSGEKLAGKRRQAGMTQAQLAHRVEVHPVTVSRWEIGDRNPDLPMVEAIAKNVGCTPLDLFEIAS